MIATHKVTRQNNDTELLLSPRLELVLHEFSTQPPELGVPLESLPQITFETLDEFVPAPDAPKRIRRKSERRYKPYMKAYGRAIVQSCLDLAILPDQLALRINAIQPELPFYETEEGKQFAGLAVLAMNGLADLAKKVGLSYAQTQQIVLLLITLGFMRRFKTGRRFIYAIPLDPYAPYPSPSAVQDKLANLLQQLDQQQDSSSKSAKEKRARFRRTVLEVKQRYENRYGLADKQSRIAQNCNSTMDNVLREIQDVLPTSIRISAMPAITKIIARHLSEKNVDPFLEFPQQGLGNEAIVVTSTLGHNGERTQQQGERTESPNSWEEGDSVLSSQKQSPLGSAKQHIASNKAGGGSTEDEKVTNLLFSSQADQSENFPTLQRSITSSVLDSQEESIDTNVKGTINSTEIAELTSQAEMIALSLEEDWSERTFGGQKQRVNWIEVEKHGQITKLPCADPNVKLIKAGCHRDTLAKTDPVIAKAAFVYTLLRARGGHVKTARAAYFTTICRLWMEHETYEKACKANTESRGTKYFKGGKGVPRQVRKIMVLFGACTYEELDILISRCTDDELTQLTDHGVPPEFAWACSSLASGNAIPSAFDTWLMSLQSLGKRSPEPLGMPEEEAKILLGRIPVEMPAMHVLGMQDGKNGTYFVSTSLRGETWKIHTIGEWDSYMSGLKRIEQMKQVIMGKRRETMRDALQA